MSGRASTNIDNKQTNLNNPIYSKNVESYLENNGGTKQLAICNTCRTCLAIPTNLKENVEYIVAAVLFNKDDKVLLIQESKQSCHGKWYLPAGRVELGENLCDAIKREVLEESGYVFTPTGVVSVEFSGSKWMRFLFTGIINSGDLKKVPDKESLQAEWIKDMEAKTLRHSDIIALVDLTRNYLKNHRSSGINVRVLPTLSKQSLQVYRMLIIFETENQSYALMIDEKTGSDLPTACFCYEEYTPSKLAMKYLNKCVATDSGALKLMFENPKVFGIEHFPDKRLVQKNQTPKYLDGMVINFIITCKSSNSNKVEPPRLRVNENVNWAPIVKSSKLFNLVKRHSTYGAVIIDLKSNKTSISKS